MGKKRAKHKKKPARHGPKSPPSTPKARPATAWWLFAWGLLVHLVFLQDDSATAFFFGDGQYYLQKARHLTESTSLDAGLPFHPPLTAWLLVPLWWIVPEGSVYVAAKVLMALACAATYALLYLLLKPRLPYATPLLALLPLGFGELLLSATPNNEAIYRLLLAVLLWLGTRWPLAGGVVHGLAALTRAEHLILGLALAAFGLAQARHRRFAALTASAALAVLLPYTIAVSADLRAYNSEHADRLPEPLPTVVPVSFYGPLNFALAHTEDDIHFSRTKLDRTSGDAAALDPLHPQHNAYILHGYRKGLAAIWEAPGRFVERSFAKAGHSLRAFAYGWTWRDLPKGPLWTRQPVDMALASAPVYEIFVALLIVLGAWHLRRDRWLLGLGFALVAYRLAINVAFFPYLRGMMIAAPFALVLLFAGLTKLFKHFTPRVAWTLCVVFALFHFSTGFGERRYLSKGERDADGRIIEDRPVVLKYAGGTD